MKLRACLVALLLSAGAVLAPGRAMAEERYDPQKAGHPIRIAAYVLYPLGVIFDYMVMRPAYYLGNHEPFKTLFGVQRHE